MANIDQISSEIKVEYPTLYRDGILPEPHVPKGRLKTIVLGTDPSTPDHRSLDIVFGLEEDQRYLLSILKNLAVLKLTLDNVFIQNV